MFLHISLHISKQLCGKTTKQIVQIALSFRHLNARLLDQPSFYFSLQKNFDIKMSFDIKDYKNVIIEPVTSVKIIITYKEMIFNKK